MYRRLKTIHAQWAGNAWIWHKCKQSTTLFISIWDCKWHANYVFLPSTNASKVQHWKVLKPATCICVRPGHPFSKTSPKTKTILFLKTKLRMCVASESRVVFVYCHTQHTPFIPSNHHSVLSFYLIISLSHSVSLVLFCLFFLLWFA